jgi:periplasmic protein TonB
MSVSDIASITKKTPMMQSENGVSISLAILLHAAFIAAVLFWQTPAKTAVNTTPIVLLNVAASVDNAATKPSQQPKTRSVVPTQPKPLSTTPPPTESRKPASPPAVLPNPTPVIHAPTNTEVSPAASTVPQTPINNTPTLVPTPTTTNTPAVQQTNPVSTASSSNNSNTSTETIAPASVKTPVIFNAGYLNNPPPVYPNISRMRGETGKVLLRVEVNREGRANKVELHRSSGSQKLDEAAIRVVNTWNFVPAKVDGVAITSTVIVPIDFQLD